MKQPSSQALRDAAHALSWARFGYASPQMAHVEEVQAWLLALAGPLPARPHVRADDLVLYAVNTGGWYQLHMKFARTNQHPRVWRAHLRRRVMYAYRIEVEPAYLMPLALFRAARELRAYYVQAAAEADVFGQRHAGKPYSGRAGGAD